MKYLVSMLPVVSVASAVSQFAAGNIVNDEFGKPTLDYGETGRPGSYNDFNPLGGLTLDKAKIQNDGASVRTGVTFGGDSDKLGAFKGLKPRQWM